MDNQFLKQSRVDKILEIVKIYVSRRFNPIGVLGFVLFLDSMIIGLGFFELLLIYINNNFFNSESLNSYIKGIFERDLLFGFLGFLMADFSARENSILLYLWSALLKYIHRPLFIRHETMGIPLGNDLPKRLKPYKSILIGGDGSPEFLLESLKGKKNKLKKHKSIIYSGIADLPFVFLLGFWLRGKSLDLLEWDRKSNEFIHLENNNENFPDMMVQEFKKSELGKSISLCISISNEIKDDEVKYLNGKSRIIHLKTEILKDEILNSKEQLESYLDKISILLKELYKSGVENINLFYAGPTSLALKIGAIYRPNYMPLVKVYSYNKGKYSWSLHVSNNIKEIEVINVNKESDLNG